MPGERAVLGGTNWDFSKVLGLSQGTASLLRKQTEQTFSLQMKESKFLNPKKNSSLCMLVAESCQKSLAWPHKHLMGKVAWKAGEVGGEQGPSETLWELLLCGRFVEDVEPWAPAPDCGL